MYISKHITCNSHRRLCLPYWRIRRKNKKKQEKFMCHGNLKNSFYLQKKLLSFDWFTWQRSSKSTVGILDTILHLPFAEEENMQKYSHHGTMSCFKVMLMFQKVVKPSYHFYKRNSYKLAMVHPADHTGYTSR